MKCGDIVYHECFDQERERIFLEQNIPSLCWKETPIIRCVDPSSFMATPENGVVWRGMIATYPTPVSAQLVQASRFAANRLSIFNSDLGDRSIELGPKALALSIHQQLHSELASPFLLSFLFVQIFSLLTIPSVFAILQSGGQVVASWNLQPWKYMLHECHTSVFDSLQTFARLISPQIGTSIPIMPLFTIGE